MRTWLSVLNSLRNSVHYLVHYLPTYLKSYHKEDLQSFINLLLSFGDVISEIPHDSISLSEVMLLKFRNDEGKADFMREVLSKRVGVIGRTGDGLAGLLFDREIVEHFLRDKRAEAENGTWSLREAAKYLHCDQTTLPTLIQQDLVEAVEVSTGKRVTEKSVKEFDARFVSLAKLAKSNETSSRCLQFKCMNQNIPLELFRRGYGKVDQPFVRREYLDLLNEIITGSKRVPRLSSATLMCRYLDGLRKDGALLPRRAGIPNKAAIAKICGFDRNILYKNEEAMTLLNAFDMEDRQLNSTKWVSL